MTRPLPEDVRASLDSDTCAQYDELPDSIKATLSRKEFIWLTDKQKAELVQQATEPDWDEP